MRKLRESVLPCKDPKSGTVMFYELKPSGDYIRVIEREGYKEPEQYAESVNNGHGN